MQNLINIKNNCIDIIESKDLYYILNIEEKEYSNELVFSFLNSNLASKIYILLISHKNTKIELKVKVVIPKSLEMIDTYLSIKSVLLDKSSHISVTPSMEVLSKNVKAGHGATITNIDDNYVYYLKSKGLKIENINDLVIQSLITNYNK